MESGCFAIFTKLSLYGQSLINTKGLLNLKDVAGGMILSEE